MVLSQANAPIDRIHRAVILQSGLTDGGDAVERVVARLNRERSGPPLEVSVAKQAGGNAFTLPGRWVYIGAKLANGVEALTAFVVAHEMAHHDLGHIGQLATVESVSEDGGAGTLRALADCTAHSLEQEIEADRRALELCREAGFSESGAREAFAIFEQVEREMKRLERRRRVPGAVTTLEILISKLGIVRPDAPVARRRRALWALVPTKRFLPTRYGLSSTRMVFACARCLARFGPQAMCPRCQSTMVYSLADPAARSRLLGALALPQPGWPGWWFIAAFPFALLTQAHVLGAAPAVIAAILASAGFLHGLVHHRDFNDPVAQFRPVPAAPQLLAANTRRVSGQIRIVHAVTSPSGTPCAVWQIRGKGPLGLLDDAGVGRFDIVDGGRIVGRVECDDALVDLGRNQRWKVRRVEGGLEDFLAARGCIGARRARVAESVLCEGDRVEVCGVADDELIVDGQRGTTSTSWFRDWPSIRKL